MKTQETSTYERKELQIIHDYMTVVHLILHSFLKTLPCTWNQGTRTQISTICKENHGILEGISRLWLLQINPIAHEVIFAQAFCKGRVNSLSLSDQLRYYWSIPQACFVASTRNNIMIHWRYSAISNDQ